VNSESRVFAEFYEGARDDCLRAVFASVGDRQVVALRLFLDLDVARTAETLGIAPGTVTAHLSRAIATLREEFAPIMHEEFL
jgi:predicted RNA polymerase sigma factor